VLALSRILDAHAVKGPDVAPFPEPVSAHRFVE